MTFHDSFACAECGPVVHDPTDPFDQAHCYCQLLPAFEALKCECQCHRPLTMADLL